MFNLTKGKKMSITKKHFKAVAEIIDSHNFNYLNEPEDIVLGYSIDIQDNKRKLVNSFIEYFKTQNKNFDSFKFYNACMKSQYKKSDELCDIRNKSINNSEVQ
jgi:hypothetical protein